MPEELEEGLMRGADARGLTGKERDAYIYGAMRMRGWKPSGEISKQAAQVTELLGLLDKIAASGKPGKVLSKLASVGRASLPDIIMTSGDACPTIKQAWPKKGIVERMMLFPFRYPKTTVFGGGLGLGYWLANKANTVNNYYQEDTPYSP